MLSDRRPARRTRARGRPRHNEAGDQRSPGRPPSRRTTARRSDNGRAGADDPGQPAGRGLRGRLVRRRAGPGGPRWPTGRPAAPTRSRRSGTGSGPGRTRSGTPSARCAARRAAVARADVHPAAGHREHDRLGGGDRDPPGAGRGPRLRLGPDAAGRGAPLAGGGPDRRGDRPGRRDHRPGQPGRGRVRRPVRGAARRLPAAARLPPAEGPRCSWATRPTCGTIRSPRRGRTGFRRAAREQGLPASGLAGLHAHFFLATARHAVPGDLGVLITAAEWLDVNYGRLVRELLLGRARRPGGPPDRARPPRCSRTRRRPRSSPASGRAPPRRRSGCAGWPARRNSARWRAAPRWPPRCSAPPPAGDRCSGPGASPHQPVGQPGPDQPDPDQPAQAPGRLPEGHVELGELCRVHRGQVTGANAVWVTAGRASPGPGPVLCPRGDPGPGADRGRARSWRPGLRCAGSSACLRTWTSLPRGERAARGPVPPPGHRGRGRGLLRGPASHALVAGPAAVRRRPSWPATWAAGRRSSCGTRPGPAT